MLIRPDRLRQAVNSEPPQTLDIPEFIEAAVLVPVIHRRDVITLGYTLRPENMPTHGGQISFPGGRREPQDDEPSATALREACEELGLDLAAVEVIGAIDDVASHLGFVVTPVVGWLEDPPAIRVDSREVESYF